MRLPHLAANRTEIDVAVRRPKRPSMSRRWRGADFLLEWNGHRIGPTKIRSCGSRNAFPARGPPIEMERTCCVVNPYQPLSLARTLLERGHVDAIVPRTRT